MTNPLPAEATPPRYRFVKSELVWRGAGPAFSMVYIQTRAQVMTAFGWVLLPYEWPIAFGPFGLN